MIRLGYLKSNPHGLILVALLGRERERERENGLIHTDMNMQASSFHYMLQLGAVGHLSMPVSCSLGLVPPEPKARASLLSS